LWTDLDRWATFIDGFAHVVERPPEWPAVAAKLVWQSTRGGRGRVTERVVHSDEDALVTEVYEERLHGTQTVSFARGEGGATHVRIELEYELARGGPLRFIADALFIRRAQRDALRRTIGRFRVEAEEEAALR
jgi:hypothetical protein